MKNRKEKGSKRPTNPHHINQNKWNPAFLPLGTPKIKSKNENEGP